ncbi:MAG: histidinol dehydrogenase [Atopobiaceae bacterium]|jgi:histidinol dehydrogenase|nr:histidinol dehydrogenase [Atopobiaceae bacterium]MCI2172945.1 histidinol dehydrogenase [Atopobiaceae bacterium]MCI2208350.1 histidinol dehydrogenase [Atopobiaceae bacterium]
MRTIELTGGRRLAASDLSRTGALPADVMESAAAIVGDVRSRGDVAVREYCMRFDGACPDAFRVPDEVVAASVDMVDAEFLSSLRKAHEQIREFHQREATQSWFTTRADGTLLGVKVTPMPSVGIYVPGGRAQYPSTVLMNAVPAKVAGVRRVIMVTPPQRDGSLSAYTLAAASVAGVDEVYAVGGAQAIAALAYGTETIPKVAKITGPGNAYVAAAKRHVSGDVGIDMVAGPSEVCVLADSTADPVVVAADLMAQAEHDPMAACYLVTCDATLPDRVASAARSLNAQSPRAEIVSASFADNGTCVVADDLAVAVDAVNVIAPEHLELHCADAMSLLGSIENAGAIFVGPWSSEPLGDYVAGPNHTLPTGGTAAFSNPLGVYDFVKRSSVIAYTKAGLMADAPAVQAMAQAEGLWAHALSVGLRRKLVEQGVDTFADPSSAVADAGLTAWPRTLDAPGVPNLSGAPVTDPARGE